MDMICWAPLSPFVCALSTCQGFELDVTAWQPLADVENTHVWVRWQNRRTKPDWFRAVAVEEAANSFKAAMRKK